VWSQRRTQALRLAVCGTGAALRNILFTWWRSVSSAPPEAGATAIAHR